MATLDFYKNNEQFSNWYGTVTFKPAYVIKPFHIDDLVEAVKLASSELLEVRVRGYGGASPPTCVTPHVLIDITTYNKPIKVDRVNKLVEVEAGMTMRQLNEYLERRGLALPVQGIWQDVTIGGVVATAAHGTGATYGIVASYVTSITLVTASGEVKVVSREADSDIYCCVPGSLGMLGILATLTIQCEPMYKLHLAIASIPIKTVMDSYEKEIKEAEHYQFNYCPGVEGAQIMRFNRTTGTDMINPQPSVLSRVGDALGGGISEFFYLVSSLIPCASHQANKMERFTFYQENRDIVGPGFKLMTVDNVSAFPKCVSLEWAIPVKHTKEAIRDLNAWISQSKFPVHNAIHARFSCKDDFYLSPAYKRDVCWIQLLTRRPFGKGIDQGVLHKAFITVMKRYDGRPHPAKWVDETEDYSNFFPEWRRFLDMRQTMDPNGLFLNDKLRKLVERR